jgi:hypothetical protein
MLRSWWKIRQADKILSPPSKSGKNVPNFHVGLHAEGMLARIDRYVQGLDLQHLMNEIPDV